jgi:hypothetical protein
MPDKDADGKFIPKPPIKPKPESRSARRPQGSEKPRDPHPKITQRPVEPGTSVSARDGTVRRIDVTEGESVGFTLGQNSPLRTQQHLRTISTPGKTATYLYMEHQKLLGETLTHVNDGTIVIGQLLTDEITMQRAIHGFRTLSGNAREGHKEMADAQFKLVEQLGKAYLTFQAAQNQAAQNQAAQNQAAQNQAAQNQAAQNQAAQNQAAQNQAARNEITKIVEKIYVAANKKAPQINNANFEEVIVGAAKLGLITGLYTLMLAQRPDRVTFQKPRR